MTGDVRKKIERCASGLMKYLGLLEASGRYKLRKNIRLSDVELRRYFDLMKSEILLLVVDAIAFEAFLAYEDERLAGEGILQRLRSRRSLVGRWIAYSAGVKDGLVIKKDAETMKLEEKTDEQYYERGHEAARKPEGGTEGDVAGQARAVPDPQVRKRRKGRGAAPEHGADPGREPRASIRHTPGLDHPGSRWG